jgi:uncharacterized protein YacL
MTDTMVLSLIIVSVLVVLLAVLRLRHVSLQGLVLGLIGAILGLLLGALASVPLSKLPGPWGGIMPMVVSIGFTLILMAAVLSRRRVLLSQLAFLRMDDKKSAEAAPVGKEPVLPQILVDTSVIIDGRIADIATAGFVPGRLAVPRFVLAELQNIADSDDAMRRGRGRRGLDVLNRLREMPGLEVTIIEDDVPSIREVDAKLVALAQKFSCNVLTTDYNLNRVAQIQGVRVLNVNELSNAIRPVVLPGEELLVRVVQPGKERNQGVGYLADGTMIVVENGDKLIGQEVSTEVTRVFQTVAGKMIFAVPRQVPGHPSAGGSSSGATHSTAVAEPTTKPAGPAAAPDDTHSTDKAEEGAGARKRFGRGRKRNGNSNSNGAGNNGSTAQADAPARRDDIEGRIIAATNKPHRPTDQS